VRIWTRGLWCTCKLLGGDTRGLESLIGVLIGRLLAGEEDIKAAGTEGNPGPIMGILGYSETQVEVMGDEIKGGVGGGWEVL
jgi:hypothetical protein